MFLIMITKVQGELLVKKVLVNAMPLTVMGTGIGRYLRGLYSFFEAEYGHDFDYPIL